MQHSYDSFDRPGGFSRINLMLPLRHRDFALLWGGQIGSLLGDGVFLVAMAWQVYALSNAPTALSMVGIAMTVPTIVCLLPGGVLSDRLSRRAIMLAADAVRAIAIAVLAALSITGRIEVWEIAALAMVYGAGTAFFTPAFEALVPDILPSSDLPAANSLDQFVRPIALRLAGPAIGGWLIAAFGPGLAFAADAASFVAAGVAVLAMRPVSRHVPEGLSVMADIRGGLGFIRGRTWIWGTLVSAAFAYLLFLGPTEVLLPYVVKNGLHGSAGMLGAVFAAGGIGSIGAAVLMGQRAQPRRQMTFIYVVWTLATLAVAGYGLATATWQLVVACLLFNALETAGTIVWATLKQRHVPASMLGRVSSLDWLISIGLLPLSFALTAPVTELIGARLTLVGAGVGGAIITLAALFLPGMRDVEREEPPAGEPAPADLPVDVVIVATVLHQAPAGTPVAAVRRIHP
jgi:MFS family permease